MQVILYLSIVFVVMAAAYRLIQNRKKALKQTIQQPEEYSGIDSRLNIERGKKYRVIKSFTDYDREIHAIGETWKFLTTNFLPYEDGLTLHVQLERYRANNIQATVAKGRTGRYHRAFYRIR